MRRCFGLGVLPSSLIVNETPGRREVKRLTGDHWVPALITDGGRVVNGSHEMRWAAEHPAPGPAAAEVAA